MKNYLKLSLIFMGTIIGAGFASGREIYDFFDKFPNKCGILLSTFLFVFTFYALLKVIQKNKVTSVNSFLKGINKNIASFYKIILLLFLIVSYIVMISASSTLFMEELGINYIFGGLAMSIAVFLVLFNGKSGIVKLNTVLTPLIILMVLYLGIVSYEPVFATYHLQKWWISGILYTSYNLITILPVAAPLHCLITDKKTPIKTAIVSGFLIFLLLGIMIVILPDSDVAMPLLTLAVNLGGNLHIVYSFLLFLAILTTAVSSGFGATEMIFEMLQEMLSKTNNNVLKKKFNCKIFVNKVNKKTILLVIIAVGMALCKFSFKTLVSSLYPVFGVLGLFSMCVIIKIYLQSLKNH